MMNYQRHPIGINMPQAPQTSYIQPAIQLPAQAPRQKPARALVGFANVPKFTPPNYDGVLPEDLPCPDTPSPRESLVSSPDEPRMGNLAEEYARAEGTRNHGGTRRQGSGGAESRSKVLTPKDAKESQPYPPGSFVEYRSRTMQDRWILAKVESFDEKNRVYKLDVQPKAPMDRVRLRTPAASGGRSDASQQKPPEKEAQLAVVASQDRPRKVDGLHEVIDPYEDESMNMIAAVQEMSRDELRVRVEQLISENVELKQLLDAERERANVLEAQLHKKEF